MRFFKSSLNIDFMGVQKWALIGSLLVISIGIISLLVKGGPKYGVDFSGGTLVQVKFNIPMDAQTLRDALNDMKIGEMLIQRFGSKADNEFLLRMSQTSSSIEGFESTIKDELLKDFSPDAFEIRRVEMVGPKVGADLREKGFWAIIFATLLVLIYVWWRFEFVYSLGAILALVHDVLVTLGLFSLTNREITLPVIAAFLTIIGYSLNDTIVIFDRVRENYKPNDMVPLEQTLNKSINETLSRTILTSLTTFFVVLALYVLGGEVINDFSFAMMIGVIVGTYSSVYIASPVALFFHNLSPSAKSSNKSRLKSAAKNYEKLASKKQDTEKKTDQQKQPRKTDAVTKSPKKGQRKSRSGRRKSSKKS